MCGKIKTLNHSAAVWMGPRELIYLHVYYSCVSRKMAAHTKSHPTPGYCIYIILCRQETDEHVKITPDSLGHCIKKYFKKCMYSIPV